MNIRRVQQDNIFKESLGSELPDNELKRIIGFSIGHLKRLKRFLMRILSIKENLEICSPSNTLVMVEPR